MNMHSHDSRMVFQQEGLRFITTMVAGIVIVCLVLLPAKAQWVVEVVDSGPYVGGESSFALDSADHPHIAYYGGDGRLKYAHYDDELWHTEIVDDTGTAGWFCSLALDSQDRPHISYRDINEGDLKYAWHDGTSWHIEMVDSNALVRGMPSLALDSADRPRIAYFDMGEDIVKHAWYDGSSWRIEEVVSAGRGYVSIALDLADHSHIVIGDGTLRYAVRSEGAWQVEPVDSSSYLGQWNSLALDSADRPHISYYDWGNENLKYAWYDGTRWYSETADSEGNVGGSTSIALDSEGRPHISYMGYDDMGSIDAIKFAWKRGMTWFSKKIGIDGDCPYPSLPQEGSLALDHRGFPHITYCCGPWNAASLNYAYRISPLPSSALFRVTKEGDVYADKAYYGQDFLTDGADIAEQIKVSEPVEPGDVVALDPDNPSYDRKSREPYSTLASGVISTQPGFTLGLNKSHLGNQTINFYPLFEPQLVFEGVSLDDLLDSPAVYTDTGFDIDLTFETITQARIYYGQRSLPNLSLTSLKELLSQGYIEYTLNGKPLLALMGVVPVKATTENGPIKPGDLLVSSSTPGHVMVCKEKEKCAGAIIGKALEPLEEGAGIIKMLVMR